MWEEPVVRRHTDREIQEHIRKGVLGNNAGCSNAHELEIGFSYNGSGKEAFGGADQWPTIKIKIAFPSDRQDLANTIGKELMEWIDERLSREGL